MDRHAAALVLDEIATLLAITGGDRFRVRAYRGAASALESAQGDLAELLESGQVVPLHPGLDDHLPRDAIDRQVVGGHDFARRRVGAQGTALGAAEAVAHRHLVAFRDHVFDSFLGVGEGREFTLQVALQLLAARDRRRRRRSHGRSRIP